MHYLCRGDNIDFFYSQLSTAMISAIYTILYMNKCMYGTLTTLDAEITTFIWKFYREVA